MSCVRLRLSIFCSRNCCEIKIWNTYILTFYICYIFHSLIWFWLIINVKYHKVRFNSFSSVLICLNVSRMSTHFNQKGISQLQLLILLPISLEVGMFSVRLGSGHFLSYSEMEEASPVSGPFQIGSPAREKASVFFIQLLS